MLSRRSAPSAPDYRGTSPFEWGGGFNIGSDLLGWGLTGGDMSESGLFRHDDLLGHGPNPGFSGPGFGRSFHTIDAEGFRSCGEPPPSGEGGTILTVGDSFTYGDEVRDESDYFDRPY